MLDKFKQLMEVKKQADAIKRELDAVTVEVEEIKGIRIVITGSQSFRSVAIAPELFGTENKGRFEADLLRSLNAAVKKAQQVAAQKMAAVMPGLS